MFSRRRFLKLAGTSLLAGPTAVNARRAMPQKNKRPPYEITGVSLLQDSTPQDDGFFFPAEWHPHKATLMALPPAQNWQGFNMADVRQEWANVANTLADYETVIMVVRPDDAATARHLLSSSIEIVKIPINDGWARDSGPIVLINALGEKRVAGFTFNSWGEKFKPYRGDALLKARLCSYLDMSFYPVDLVLEGGAISVDGEGTLITTEQCLLNPNRNPDKSREEIEQLLKQYLNVQKIIWLAKGTVPDPITDGHTDGLCVFASPGTVLLTTTDDRSDRNFAICQNAKKRLQETRDASGRKLTIIEIPIALDVLHINFYLANNAVIVPIANDPKQDDSPLAILKDVFPDRKIVGVGGRIIAKGGGGIHCITQQIPDNAVAI